MSGAEQVDPTGRLLQERSIVFLGGYGYDRERNLEVGRKIMDLAGYSDTLSIPDLPKGQKDGIVVYKYSDGAEKRLPGKVALKNLDSDDSDVRYMKLHEERARDLIAAIEENGGKPVDAVFQSVDVSTGILAMHQRPELFNRVVLLDPSSIIKLPSRKKFLQEAWRDGRLVEILKSKKASESTDRFEAKPSLMQRVLRPTKSRQNGNFIASYISSQATMLHEIAQSQHAPDLAIIASQFDHAYDPLRILSSLVSLDDIQGFFVTNMRHGLAGKQIRLEQLVSVLGQAGAKESAFTDKLHFFTEVTDEYRQKILAAIQARMDG